jgi:polyisoprenoid-binding protein YceI
MRVIRIISRLSLVSLACHACLSVSACNTDPAKDKSKATVAEAVSVAAPSGASNAGATVYAFSQDDSKLEFVGAKVTGKEEGYLKVFSGKIQSPDGKPENSTVNAEMDIASLTMGKAKLMEHLKSPDFFDAARFPKGTFVSTSVKAGGEKGATHTITGNLTLHGVTKSITFPATIHIAADSAQTDAEFAINRKDFGIAYPGAPDDLIKDEVLVKLTIRAKKAS